MTHQQSIWYAFLHFFRGRTSWSCLSDLELHPSSTANQLCALGERSLDRTSPRLIFLIYKIMRISTLHGFSKYKIRQVDRQLSDVQQMLNKHQLLFFEDFYASYGHFPSSLACKCQYITKARTTMNAFKQHGSEKSQPGHVFNTPSQPVVAAYGLIDCQAPETTTLTDSMRNMMPSSLDLLC